MQRLEKVIAQLRVVGNSIVNRNAIYQRCYCSKEKPLNDVSNVTEKSIGGTDENLGGFAKAFGKHQDLLREPQKKPDNPTFAALVRHSKFIDLGDPEGKFVTGKIYHTVGSDLYIDFGWKFPCVCTKPLKNNDGYVRGAIVRLQVKDLELSSKFLGTTKDLTLLEADCILLGLVSTPFAAQKANTSSSRP